MPASADVRLPSLPATSLRNLVENIEHSLVRTSRPRCQRSAASARRSLPVASSRAALLVDPPLPPLLALSTCTDGTKAMAHRPRAAATRLAAKPTIARPPGAPWSLAAPLGVVAIGAKPAFALFLASLVDLLTPAVAAAVAAMAARPTDNVSADPGAAWIHAAQPAAARTKVNLTSVHSGRAGSP